MKTPMLGAAALLAAPLLAVSPLAAEPDKQEEASEKADKDDAKANEEAEPKKICRRIATDISSRQRTKLCMTSDEWKAWRKAQRNSSY